MCVWSACMCLCAEILTINFWRVARGEMGLTDHTPERHATRTIMFKCVMWVLAVNPCSSKCLWQLCYWVTSSINVEVRWYLGDCHAFKPAPGPTRAVVQGTTTRDHMSIPLGQGRGPGTLSRVQKLYRWKHYWVSQFAREKVKSLHVNCLVLTWMPSYYTKDTC